MKSSNYGNLNTQPKIAIANVADFLGVTTQAVHKQLKDRNIVCPRMGNKLFINFEIARKLLGINFHKKKIVGQIVKGGTGKTTAIDNISSCANSYGARVLKIDADPQGNLTDANGVDAEELPVLIDAIKNDVTISECIVNLAPGMDLIPSRIENVILDNEIVNKRLPLDKLYSNLLHEIEDNYDFIFIDCPPTMGQAVTAASLYADIILAPLNPDQFSAKGLKILRNEIKTLNDNFFKDKAKKIEYKIFLNKFSGKTLLSDKALYSLLSDPDLDNRLLPNTIQYTQEIPNITDESKNLFSVLKKSVVRDDFDQITKSLLDIEPVKLSKKDNNTVSIKNSFEVQEEVASA